MILERTVTAENGRTVLKERRIYGVLDMDGVFYPLVYRGKCFPLRQESGKVSNKGRTAA